MDTYAADVADWSRALDLRNAIHIGHSTGGGEVAHMSRGPSRARRQGGADRRGAAGDGQEGVEPGGTPIEVFDGFRARSPPTARSSISISRAGRSTASTGRARRSRKA
jgi:non-heme chloroperoxidase